MSDYEEGVRDAMEVLRLNLECDTALRWLHQRIKFDMEKLLTDDRGVDKVKQD